MSKPNDAELAAYVEMHQCCVDEQAEAIVAKAGELLDSAKSSPHVHRVGPAEDSKKIAEDALGLLYNFEEISAEIELTNDAEFKKLWDENYQLFRDGLKEAVQLAEDSKKYMQKFNETVVQHFSEDNVDWQGDRDMIANFIKDNDGAQLAERSKKISQMFTNIRYSTESFEQMYGEKTTEKGNVYDAKLKQIDEDRRRVQSQLNSNRASSAQLRSSMSRTSGPFGLIGWIVRAICTLLGRRSRTFSVANSRVTELEREEQELVSKKAEIDKRSAAMVKDASALTQTRHAMSKVVDNVGDISERLTTLGQSWADINHHFVKMSDMLQNAATETNKTLFLGSMKIMEKSTTLLTSNLEGWTNGIAPGGVLAKPKKKPSAYDISDNYGGTDALPFNDAKPDLDPAMSIAMIKIIRGGSIDGFHVTYRLKNGESRAVQHGTERNRDFETVSLTESEYINMASGKYVATGVQQLTMQITDSKTGKRRIVGPYGTSTGGTGFTWTGRLLCVGGVAKNDAPSQGLRALKLVQLKAKEAGN